VEVFLRKVELADFEIFKKYADDEEIHQYNSFDIYKKAKEVGFDAFLNDKYETRYAICLIDTGEIIGDIGERIVPGSPDIKFGLTIFRKDLWDKGLGYLAVTQLLDKLRARGIKKVVLDADKRNKRALHLYKKMGFTYCGESDKKFNMSIKL
jgi:RimJ/RimL family protein N-acetyltransferase